MNLALPVVNSQQFELRNGHSTGRDQTAPDTLIVRTDNVNTQSSESLHPPSNYRFRKGYPTLASHKFGLRMNSNALNTMKSRDTKLPVRLASGQQTAPAKRHRNRRFDDSNEGSVVTSQQTLRPNSFDDHNGSTVVIGETANTSEAPKRQKNAYLTQQERSKKAIYDKKFNVFNAACTAIKVKATKQCKQNQKLFQSTIGKSLQTKRSFNRMFTRVKE